MLEEYLPDHNESISAVLDKFAAMGIDTPGVVALLGNPPPPPPHHAISFSHTCHMMHPNTHNVHMFFSMGI